MTLTNIQRFVADVAHIDPITLGRIRWYETGALDSLLSSRGSELTRRILSGLELAFDWTNLFRVFRDLQEYQFPKVSSVSWLWTMGISMGVRADASSKAAVVAVNSPIMLSKAGKTQVLNTVGKTTRSARVGS